MKRIVLMILLLIMMCISAIGETTEVYTYDFGDFTIDLDDNARAGANDKMDGELWLLVMPDYVEETSFHDNLNLIWQSFHHDLSVMDVDVFVNASVEQISMQLESEGVDVSGVEVLESGLMEHEGMQGIYFLLKTDYAYMLGEQEIDMTLYIQTSVFSAEERGSYTFTLTAKGMNEITRMREILNTIHWK